MRDTQPFPHMEGKGQESNPSGGHPFHSWASFKGESPPTLTLKGHHQLPPLGRAEDPSSPAPCPTAGELRTRNTVGWRASSFAFRAPDFQTVALPSLQLKGPGRRAAALPTGPADLFMGLPASTWLSEKLGVSAKIVPATERGQNH
ncbi:hypothetical protein Cadr_000004239 [Camelus dromedarius]|uniref:Uncharacterized protein n=1 Tax=Camelus dromedarius TaxID=9838 RepID=A0A5N4EE20_CAMDR|nr:hypothetical protein Cadr_000004239 [Camelus dromedarius]